MENQSEKIMENEMETASSGSIDTLMEKRPEHEMETGTIYRFQCGHGRVCLRVWLEGL